MNPPPRYCNQCGAVVNYGARFCSKCGAPLENIGASPGEISPTEIVPQSPAFPSPETEQPAIYKVTPPEGKKANWPMIALGAVAAGVLVFCLGVGLVWGYTQFIAAEDTATPTTEEGEVAETAAPSNETLAPTKSPSPSPTLSPEPPGILAQYAHTQFRYEPPLARNVHGETVPGSTDPNLPYFEIYPEYIRFLFDGYPLYPEAFHTPQIMVFPASEYAALNPGAQEEINNLKSLLASRVLPPANERLPFLPGWNAAQLFRSNAKFIEFQNGSGMRYLAQYGQAANPINSRELFYTFQGITQDGKFYISAILPVAHPSLPDPNTVVINDAFYNNYENYTLDMAAQLSAQPDESFSPPLNLLDALIQSIIVESS